MTAPLRLLLVGLVLAGLAAAGWVFTFEDTELPADAVWGGYRDRWFVLNVLLTYAAAWLVVLGLFRASRPTLVKAAAFQVVLAVTLALLELPAMLGLIDYEATSTAIARAFVGEEDIYRLPDQHIVEEGYPDMFWILGIDAELVPIDYRSDRFALRNSENYYDPKVFCLGDSILVAGLVPTEELVTERLTKTLGVEVMNVSEVGIGVQREQELLGTLGFDLKGRVVLHFVFEGNDLGNSMGWASRKATEDSALSGGEIGARAPWPATGVIKTFVRSLHEPKKGLAEYQAGRLDVPGQDPRKVYFVYRSSQIDEYVAEQMPVIADALAQMDARVQAAGGRYAAVWVPNKLHVYHDRMSWPERTHLRDPSTARSEFYEGWKEACESRNLTCLDLTPVLKQALAEGRVPYFDRDTHLDGTGHEIMAEAAAPLARRLLAEVGTGTVAAAP